MTYRLRIKRQAEADLRRLPPALFERINNQLLDLRETPRPPGVRKLQGQLEGWRVRIGDYRVIYLIDDAEQTVTIVRVRHRREVYR